MRLLALCLLFCSALAHAGNGDFLKATIQGRPCEFRGNQLVSFHDTGGTWAVPDQEYFLRGGGLFAPLHLELRFYLPFGGALKTGAYALPDPLEASTPLLPYVLLRITEGNGERASVWSLGRPGECEIVITSIRGQVVEGTFRARLRTLLDESVREVTDGTFRFTMK